ncbi:uncharacterized protein BDZ99DRAFT_569424 [Mytilinidion resinicola]|uniref:Uncharacterized protein n=1 Tax=Mytilinidion resinicola TaxID=574789 RepID=A0A6A6YTR2_9PEZI|nr:uncharacterized protein BDZ99DRAFT_569424 [Mytilinidion resinicola]KAF2811355.1 hypothetical protein BDZ99DRAFT_569424 [Mytilinidion resinicola]
MRRQPSTPHKSSSTSRCSTFLHHLLTHLETTRLVIEDESQVEKEESSTPQAKEEKDACSFQVNASPLNLSNPSASHTTITTRQSKIEVLSTADV